MRLPTILKHRFHLVVYINTIHNGHLEVKQHQTDRFYALLRGTGKPDCLVELLLSGMQGFPPIEAKLRSEGETHLVKVHPHHLDVYELIFGD